MLCLLLQEILESGRVKAIGVSECSLAEAKAVHSVVPVSVVELEWSLFNRENEVSVYWPEAPAF